MMIIYKVFVDDHFIKAFVNDQTNAISLRTSLSLFFALENLPYVPRIEREVFGDA